MSSASTSTSGALVLYVATRKGAWTLTARADRRQWEIDGPHFLGHIVHHMVLDPRDGRTLVVAARTGHLGPTVFHSTDAGRNWKEASRPPAFRKAAEGEKGLVVNQVFWLTPGHASEPGVWWAGTSPQGLFRSADGGETWDSVSGFNDHPMRHKWVGLDEGTPDGAKLHSILIDPRDARHMYIGMSDGGVFESIDQGADWKPLNAGCRADFMPDPYPEYGHDTHCVAMPALDPDLLYQQNHCGLYRMRRSEERWQRIGDNMPREIGDIGFPVVVHPREPDTAWTFPMDGTEVWPRVSPEGKPAVYVTRDGGKTFTRLDRGLPRRQAWFTVLRQAMTADARDPVGVYFGTTTGEVWASDDEGESWTCAARHLPHIYAVEAAELNR